jgi:guanylate kinase
MTRQGIIFIISSPSGGGKTTLLTRVRKRAGELKVSISYTTRAMRPGEKDGADYHFIGHDLFRRRIEDGFFAEWAEVHGHHYGTSRDDLKAIMDAGQDAIMDIDVQGARLLKTAFPEAVTVFILPPSLAELERRLNGRGTESGEVVRRRLENARRELLALDRYDYLVVNRDIEESAGLLLAIISAERQRTGRYDLDALRRSILEGKE